MWCVLPHLICFIGWNPCCLFCIKKGPSAGQWVTCSFAQGFPRSLADLCLLAILVQNPEILGAPCLCAGTHLAPCLMWMHEAMQVLAWWGRRTQWIPGPADCKSGETLVQRFLWHASARGLPGQALRRFHGPNPVCLGMGIPRHVGLGP